MYTLSDLNMGIGPCDLGDSFLSISGLSQHNGVGGEVAMGTGGSHGILKPSRNNPKICN